MMKNNDLFEQCAQSIYLAYVNRISLKKLTEVDCCERDIPISGFCKCFLSYYFGKLTVNDKSDHMIGSKAISYKLC
jgi:hypothetical protein